MDSSFEERKDKFLRGLTELTKQTKIRIDGMHWLQLCNELNFENPNSKYVCDDNGEDVYWDFVYLQIGNSRKFYFYPRSTL